jgi:hypothetical protein
MQVCAIDADRFRDASTGSTEEEQERMIAPAPSRTAIRSCKESVQLLVGEELDHAPHGPLPVDRQYSLDDAHQGRVYEAHVLEERTDHRETSISSPDAVSPISLKVIEERQNEIAIQVLDQKLARRPPVPLRCEAQKQSHAVAICGDRHRAGPLLGDQTQPEERFEKRRQIRAPALPHH